MRKSEQKYKTKQSNLDFENKTATTADKTNSAK